MVLFCFSEDPKKPPAPEQDRVEAEPGDHGSNLNLGEGDSMPGLPVSILSLGP